MSRPYNCPETTVRLMVDAAPVPGTNFSVTQYGPGDRGFCGGRWWVDVNNNNVQDAGDDFFLCPLLGSGRATP
jgi:hypothetical protein